MARSFFRRTVLVLGVALVVASAAAAALAQYRPPPATPLPPQAAVPQAPIKAEESFILGIGDRLRVIVYGEPDLSGEFEIDANGAISLPLIGVVAATNQTIRGLEQNIAKRYDEFLRNPRVNLQVIQYRPFFILGEVRQPGNYAFIPGMTVKNAVALAGGYTVRGGPRGISVERATARGEGEQPATEDVPLFPGDIVRVTSRLF